jgi:hypothetical protein
MSIARGNFYRRRLPWLGSANQPHRLSMSHARVRLRFHADDFNLGENQNAIFLCAPHMTLVADVAFAISERFVASAAAAAVSASSSASSAPVHALRLFTPDGFAVPLNESALVLRDGDELVVRRRIADAQLPLLRGAASATLSSVSKLPVACASETSQHSAATPSAHKKKRNRDQSMHFRYACGFVIISMFKSPRIFYLSHLNRLFFICISSRRGTRRCNSRIRCRLCCFAKA